MNLKNKRILLTGATGGIGEPLAEMLTQKGAKLALVGRNIAKLESLNQKLGGQAVCIEADMSKPNAAEHIVQEAKTKLGVVDILINNAGVLDFIGFETQSQERIAEVIQTNVTTLIQLTRALIPDLLSRNSGHFVFVGSIFGSLGFPHFTTYCASKFAVHGFSQALRRELVDTCIGVTYIAPRAVKTPMNDAKATAMWEKSGNAMDLPEHVAQIILNALENEKQEVFIGQPQTFFAWLNGLFPQAVNMGLRKQTSLAKPFL